MPASGSATTLIKGRRVQLEAGFAIVDGGTLRVRYRVRNTGAAAIAVFDRGNRHAVLTRRQASGAVGLPRLQEEGEGAISLQHAAVGLPNPTPTLPPTPLAVRLDPGGVLDGSFTFARWLSNPPRHVRWCLGVATFDTADFHSPETVDGVEIWQASFALADRQQLLCTPWFDVDDGVFLAPS